MFAFEERAGVEVVDAVAVVAAVDRKLAAVCGAEVAGAAITGSAVGRGEAVGMTMVEDSRGGVLAVKEETLKEFCNREVHNGPIEHRALLSYTSQVSQPLQRYSVAMLVVTHTVSRRESLIFHSCSKRSPFPTPVGMNPRRCLPRPPRPLLHACGSELE